ncbi:protein of unknown function DUF901 [Stackebrandtia nassauensis DSM 44728]|uniref:RNA-binding protein with PIN domain n=2 Tax=Stackebrandtia TaxID=283810 RepID=D3Q8S7_STANL|nr:protein of unknown function DUF901 [Stackebrandtia nassauensis DSM 44728]
MLPRFVVPRTGSVMNAPAGGRRDTGDFREPQPPPPPGPPVPPDPPGPPEPPPGPLPPPPPPGPPEPTDPPSVDDEPELPEAVWQKLLPLASTALGSIRPDELPGPLRRFARFAPARRAKLAEPGLRSALRTDASFRQQVAEVARKTQSSLMDLIDAGEVPEGADTLDVAALAYVSRGTNWRDLLGSASRRVAERLEAERISARIAEAEQAAASAAHDKAIAEREAEKLRVELVEARAEAEELRRRHHGLTKELREIKRRERKVTDALSSEKGRLKQAETEHAAELRRLKSQLDESMRALERARQGARDTRALNDARVWQLLETIGGAAAGLRRELALEPAEHTPGDFVADTEAVRPGSAEPTERPRGLDSDDPARLDTLLGMPQSHLIVDGYNVTLGGYGDIPLEQQRIRLVRGLSGIAAQTGAEVTVVFDGSHHMVGLPTPPRGVRVLFSRKGQTADEVIRALTRAEPNGRPVIVISSDREVADGVRRHGAYPLSAKTLLRRLNRA